jgi:predicted MFS family arabinose efflux permease
MLGEEEKPPSRDCRYVVFLVLLCINLFNNFDTGVLPAAAVLMQRDLNLNYKKMALIGSLDYLGIVVGSFVLPFVIRKVQIRWLAMALLVVNSGMSTLIGLIDLLPLILTARTIQGFTQSFISSYLPIWINEFAPRSHATLWMGFSGSSSSLGIMIGYSCSALLSNLFDVWRPCFFVQAGLQLCIVAVLLGLREEEVNVFREKEDEPLLPVADNGYLKVLTQPVFLTITVVMCIMYFVVTAIQYWMTEFAVKVHHIPSSESNAVFAVCAITGPVLGVIAGGTVIDELGGYRGKAERLQAVKFIALFSLAGGAFGIGFLFAPNIYFIIINLWLMLFFGGGMVPICNGVCISSVQKQYQPFSSAIMQVSINMLGYFLAPIITGGIMDLFEDEVVGLSWGLRIGVSTCMLAFLISLLAVYFADQEPDTTVVNLRELRESNLRAIPNAELAGWGRSKSFNLD